MAESKEKIKKNVLVRVNTKLIQEILNGFSAGSDFQKHFDMEVAKLSDPYVPSDTVAVRKSVFERSTFGSGRLIYEIYGKKDGRNTWNDKTSIFQGRPTRGSNWTPRMLASGGAEKLKKETKKWFASGRS
jgi:hypothetical protein